MDLAWKIHVSGVLIFWDPTCELSNVVSYVLANLTLMRASWIRCYYYCHLRRSDRSPGEIKFWKSKVGFENWLLCLPWGIVQYTHSGENPPISSVDFQLRIYIKHRTAFYGEFIKMLKIQQTDPLTHFGGEEENSFKKRRNKGFVF